MVSNKLLCGSDLPIIISLSKFAKLLLFGEIITLFKRYVLLHHPFLSSLTLAGINNLVICEKENESFSNVCTS